jgi:ABC-2 type transport system ATP-binding protein
MESIVLKNLTKWYGSLVAVNDLSLTVGNEIFGLLGPNGSGKTTTIRMLTTLLTPTRGDAIIGGFSILDKGDDVRSKISYVPQEMAIDVKFTGRENVEFYAKMYGIPDRKKKVIEVLETMDLIHRADEPVKNYSGGMRRRLELAQALVHEPEVLFLDEPTVGLDVNARKKIWEHINELKNKGMTIFMTTHYLDEADIVCDRVAIMDKGSVVAIDKPARLKLEMKKDIVVAEIVGKFKGLNLTGITFLGQDGNKLSFLAENGREALPLIAIEMYRQGIGVKSMSLCEPRLDDVFLQVVSQLDEPNSFNYANFRRMLRVR